MNMMQDMEKETDNTPLLRVTLYLVLRKWVILLPSFN